MGAKGYNREYQQRTKLRTIRYKKVTIEYMQRSEKRDVNDDRKQFIECGQVTGTHGVRGEVRVTYWGDGPDYLCQFDTVYLNHGEKPLGVLRARVHKNAVLLTLEGIDTKELADTLKGEILYIDRKDDPDKTPFVQDYFGLKVSDIDTGQDYGVLDNVIFTGANQVYRLVDAEQTERLIPDIPSVIKEINLKEGWMKIRPLEGLFDDEN